MGKLMEQLQKEIDALASEAEKHETILRTLRTSSEKSYHSEKMKLLK